MANGQLPSPERVQDLLLSAAATGAALGHMDDLQVGRSYSYFVCQQHVWCNNMAEWGLDGESNEYKTWCQIL
jgi:hypothetical protein